MQEAPSPSPGAAPWPAELEWEGGRVSQAELQRNLIKDQFLLLLRCPVSLYKGCVFLGEVSPQDVGVGSRATRNAGKLGEGRRRGAGELVAGAALR